MLTEEEKIYLEKLLETSLPKGHTKEERIKELIGYPNPDGNLSLANLIVAKVVALSRMSNRAYKRSCSTHPTQREDKMNTIKTFPIPDEIKKFLDTALDEKSILDTDRYITSRKVNSEALSLTLCYVNGAAYAYGIVHDQLVKIWYNYFDHKEGFWLSVNASMVDCVLTRAVVERFFETGEIIAEPTDVNDLDLDNRERPVRHMHWYLFEAIQMDLKALADKTEVPSTLIDKANEISAGVRRSGIFTDALKKQACEVEYELYLLDQAYTRNQNNDLDA